MQTLTVSLPQFERIEIYVLSDTHIGDPLVDDRRLKQFTDELMAEPNRFCILNGDLLNMAIMDSVSDTYGEKYTPQDAIDILVAMLYPIRERILSGSTGNHEDRIQRKDGIDIMYQVFKRLFGEEDKKQRYVNGAYVLIVKFGKNNNRDDRKTCYSLFVRHGNGGGRRVGGKMNNLDDMAKICDADIYVMSHTHQPAAFRKGFSRTDYRNEKLQYCDKLFVLTNAYLFYGGYGERLGFDMPSTVYPIIYLDGESRYARCLV